MPLAPILLLFVICLGFAPGASAAATAAQLPVVAVAADMSGDASRTRLTLTLSREVAAKAVVMDGPDRVVVDLPEVNFQLPADAAKTRHGLVASFRYGLFAPGRSRLVIELARPALVANLAVEKRSDGAFLLRVDLGVVDRAAFARAVAADAEAALAAARTEEAAPSTADPTDRRPVIVIDAGHGGVDPGAVAATGVFEKEIVFAFASRLRQRLAEGGNYRVVMTRDRDVFVSLAERVRIAQNARADLFISIHADSIRAAPQVGGLTVYTSGERASDAESAVLADRENQADAAAGAEGAEGADEVADILRDLTVRETRGFSVRVAGKLVSSLDPVVRLNKNPMREAGFRVLRAPDVPSVLVELGYLSSRKDIDLLMSEEWRSRTAEAMGEAIDRYFATRVANQRAAPAPVSP